GVLAELAGQRGDLVKARAVAQVGAQAYPGTPGAVLCRAILARIEAPTFELVSMQADGLRRPSLQVTHRNLPALYFRAYALDLDGQIAASRDYGGLQPSEKQW